MSSPDLRPSEWLWPLLGVGTAVSAGAAVGAPLMDRWFHLLLGDCDLADVDVTLVCAVVSGLVMVSAVTSTTVWRALACSVWAGVVGAGLGAAMLTAFATHSLHPVAVILLAFGMGMLFVGPLGIALGVVLLPLARVSSRHRMNLTKRPRAGFLLHSCGLLLLAGSTRYALTKSVDGLSILLLAVGAAVTVASFSVASPRAGSQADDRNG